MATGGKIESKATPKRATADVSPGDDALEPMDFRLLLSIADTLPVLIAYLDTEQRYQFINRALAEWFERPRREILGRKMREVLGEDAYSARIPMIEAALAGERQWFAAGYDHPSRGPLAIQTEYVPQIGSDGKVQGVVVLVQDVTEQRVAERSLRESEERFRRIADSAPAAMWVSRLDRSRDFVNDAYAEFVGLPVREACQFDWRDALHPDDCDRIVRESIAGEASLKPFTLEARYRRADGEYRWLRSVSQPRFGPDHELIGFIGVATDFTSAKESELALQSLVEERTAELSASEARFRAIFDTVMEVVVLLRPDGTVVEVNKTPASWRDVNPRLAIGRPLWEAPTVESYPQHAEALKRGVAMAAKGEIFRDEVVMERGGTPTSVLDVSIQPVRTGDGDISYLLFEARDITELKAAQDQLRQSQKMEALGQLTGGIAHDFNNLLTVIVGGLDLISKRVEDERLLRYANNALAAADRGARLTGQLLAFSRVQRLEVKPTFVAPLIEEMRPLLRNVLGPGIEKKFDLDPHLMPVMADPTQLELAVLNLAINARDAMPDGGTLTFSSRRRRISNDPDLEPGHYIELSIADTGSGMTPDVAARAFEPFFTTKEIGKGTGLGLSMVYGMARQSGGTARLESEAGVGTTVRLFFRRAGKQADMSANAGDTGDTAKRGRRVARVLVIDDDDDVRQFIAASLQEYGHDVISAGNGQDGIAKFFEASPDLVILDFLMPGMSGADVAAHILATKPDQPILFVSGYSETDAIRKVAPHADILAKPFRAAALDEAVREALAGR
ncbi:MAG TPA: PAS domain-containing protein [Sphingomicrobium sp.]|nr:PAS domain-containing protein [Sphingomicrobium sp.]